MDDEVKLPKVNPLTLAIIALIGAVAGGISTAGTFVAFKIAEEIGKQLNPPKVD